MKKKTIGKNKRCNKEELGLVKMMMSSKQEMMMKKTWKSRSKSKCRPFMSGLVLTVILIARRPHCQDTNVFVDAIKILIINQWYYRILVGNIAREQGMKVVNMANATCYAIQEVAHHVASRFPLIAIVVKR